MVADISTRTSRRARFGWSYPASLLVGMLLAATLLFIVAAQQSVFRGWDDWGVTLVTTIVGLYVVPCLFVASVVAPMVMSVLPRRLHWSIYGLVFAAVFVLVTLVMCNWLSMSYAPVFLPIAAIFGLTGGLLIGKFVKRRGSDVCVTESNADPDVEREVSRSDN